MKMQKAIYVASAMPNTGESVYSMSRSRCNDWIQSCVTMPLVMVWSPHFATEVHQCGRLTFFSELKSQFNSIPVEKFAN